MTTRPGAVAAVANLRARPDPAAALRLFDTLPAVGIEEMFGAWRGSEVPTDHPLDGLLVSTGWHGKRFDGPDDVHPLVFSGRSGTLWSLNPALLPIRLILSRPGLARVPGTARLLRAARPVLSTDRPTARLRLTEYRGVLSATMCYDALPIHDVFRRVDDSTLLGVMDLRGVAPYVFLLQREAR